MMNLVAFEESLIIYDDLVIEKARNKALHYCENFEINRLPPYWIEKRLSK